MNQLNQELILLVDYDLKPSLTSSLDNAKWSQQMKSNENQLIIESNDTHFIDKNTNLSKSQGYYIIIVHSKLNSSYLLTVRT